MSLFYVKDGEPFIPEGINPQLVKLAKAIVKTCRLTLKFQMKTTGINNALKSGDKAQMHSLLQRALEKNKKMYNDEMALSGAAVGEVDEAFFEDKDLAFYQNQMQILTDFACITCVIEGRMFPLMAAACEKTLNKKISELLFFTNQTEIKADPADAAAEAPAAPADEEKQES